MAFPVNLTKHSFKLRKEIKDLEKHNEYLSMVNEKYARENSELILEREQAKRGHGVTD